MPIPECQRLEEDNLRQKNWKRWGPYLAERQWATVREDYSPDGDCWNSFPHDHARSRAYRWGEDGLLGVCDRECRLCFSVGLWNGQDPILKERLFGLTNPQGNHGEDVKELYYYLESSPTHSWMKALYKYPQRAFPYQEIVDANAAARGKPDEVEISDLGLFDDNRYFDIQIEYAKGGPNDLLIRLTVTNRGPDAAPLHVLPQLWFKNSWSWGCLTEGCDPKPSLRLTRDGMVEADHVTLKRFIWQAEGADRYLFTENESNGPRLFNHAPTSKDSSTRTLFTSTSSRAQAKQSTPRGTARKRRPSTAGRWRRAKRDPCGCGCTRPTKRRPSRSATALKQ